MDLDDLSQFSRIDEQNFLALVDNLPDQLWAGWELGAQLGLPSWEGIRQVALVGMGGSAIGLDLLAAYISPTCRYPVIVYRDYGLPGWAVGPESLVIACSFSGNTAETLSGLEQAIQRGCRSLVITTGGEIAQVAASSNQPCWKFVYQGSPRAAVGYSFALSAAALFRLGLIADPSNELAEAVDAMRLQQAEICAEVPAAHNPAKRLAGQCYGRCIVVYGSGALAPVARRWKGQVNELAKAWAGFDSLPEADHNSLAGTLYPEGLLSQTMNLFLRGSAEHPYNCLRSDLTRKALMLEGLGTDFVDARGEGALAQQWTALHYGDYMSYYLAMAYGIDPTPIPGIEGFKKELRAALGH